MRNNPFSFVVIFLAIGLLLSGKIGFIIPAVFLFIIYNATQGKKNKKRNQQGPRGTGRNQGQYRRRQREQDPRRQQYDQRQRRRTGTTPPPRPRQQPKPRPKPNPYKNSGVTKYKDFDYDGAIVDFRKALDIDATDIPTHFNLACAYSLTEQKDLAYQHIDRAISLGFKDLEKIKTHDAFAYIRIQKDFETFEKNGYRLTAKMDIPQQNADTVDPLLLERLKKLAELRDRGILTEEEFLVQKEKLLG